MKDVGKNHEHQEAIEQNSLWLVSMDLSVDKGIFSEPPLGFVLFSCSLLFWE